MRKSVFTVDGYADAYIGYTRGDRWNGWATPYFEKDEAIRVMQGYNEGKEIAEQMTYDEENDMFIAWLEDYKDYDYWKGEDIQTEEGIKHLYGIGAYAWVWDNAKDFILSTAQQIEDFLFEYDTYEHRDQYDDRYAVVEKIKEQLQDPNVLKSAIIILETDDLSEDEIFEKLGGILNV